MVRSRYGPPVLARHATVLRAFAVWTVWVWGTRMLNIVREDDHSLGFKAVHAVLALVSVLFALATWVIVRRERQREQ